MVAAIADAPEVDRVRLETIAGLLDRARAVGEFDRVRVAGAILPLLSEWDLLYPYRSKLREQMQALWDVVFPAIQSSVVDLFAGEYASIADPTRYRHVTFQHMHSSIALLIHHPMSRVTGGAHLHERFHASDTVEKLVAALTEQLPGDWVGAEMKAYLSGGNAATESRVVEGLASAVAAWGVPAPEPILLRREGAHAPLHMMFDRITGRFGPFSLPLDPIALGLRSRGDQNRSRGQSEESEPALFRHTPGAR